MAEEETELNPQEPEREWFVLIDGEKEGPIREIDLMRKIRDEEIPGTASVWSPGMNGWRSAVDVPGLNDALP
ncbi:MAG: DUF4339 domain-containing protein [Candidatus Brocadiia bacterium]|nr:DUF4339 domain-containing protein [Planctomycetota bacterium]